MCYREHCMVKCQLLCTISALTKLTINELGMSVYFSHELHSESIAVRMQNAAYECGMQDAKSVSERKKSFRTLQLHRVVGAVHVSAQCKVPRIYEHQP